MENITSTLPMIGDKAPAFVAETTQGHISFPQDFAGKWVILFSHPSDFTSVCTSEFVLFGARQKEFEDLDCRLLGLSVGTLPSHIAWLKSIHDHIEYRGCKKVEIRFPLIADMNMQVARMYGMIQPQASSSAAVRTLFFIDPTATIRAFISYPAQVGRNLDEVKRVLVALQTADKYHVALPADWIPGDDVVVPAPADMKDAQQQSGGITCCQWYFCTRPLDLPADNPTPRSHTPKETGQVAATAGGNRSR